MDVIKQLLVYRHEIRLQDEMTKYALETKRGQVQNLERSEAEVAECALWGNPTFYWYY